jgi:hypothetical protein
VEKPIAPIAAPNNPPPTVFKDLYAVFKVDLAMSFNEASSSFLELIFTESFCNSWVYSS